MKFSKEIVNLIANYALLKEAKLLKKSLIGPPGASPSGSGATPPPASPTTLTTSSEPITIARAGVGSGGAKAGPASIAPEAVRGRVVNVTRTGANPTQQKTKKKQ